MPQGLHARPDDPASRHHLNQEAVMFRSKIAKVADRADVRSKHR
jgi:hypothetical protein